MSDNGSDSEEEHLPRHAELITHRLTPPPLDPEDLAEMSMLSAEIDEADKFELTFEIVPEKPAEEESSIPIMDDDIERILTSPGAVKKTDAVKRSKAISLPLMKPAPEPLMDSNLDDEAEDVHENDENVNIFPKDQTKGKRPKSLDTSIANDLLREWKSPAVPIATKRNASSVERQTPKRILQQNGVVKRSKAISLPLMKSARKLMDSNVDDEAEDVSEKDENVDISPKDQTKRKIPKSLDASIANDLLREWKSPAIPTATKRKASPVESLTPKRVLKQK